MAEEIDACDVASDAGLADGDGDFCAVGIDGFGIPFDLVDGTVLLIAAVDIDLPLFVRNRASGGESGGLFFADNASEDL